MDGTDPSKLCKFSEIVKPLPSVGGQKTKQYSDRHVSAYPSGPHRDVEKYNATKTHVAHAVSHAQPDMKNV